MWLGLKQESLNEGKRKEDTEERGWFQGSVRAVAYELTNGALDLSAVISLSTIRKLCSMFRVE